MLLPKLNLLEKKKCNYKIKCFIAFAGLCICYIYLFIFLPCYFLSFYLFYHYEVNSITSSAVSDYYFLYTLHYKCGFACLPFIFFLFNYHIEHDLLTVTPSLKSTFLSWIGVSSRSSLPSSAGSPSSPPLLIACLFWIFFFNLPIFGFYFSIFLSNVAVFFQIREHNYPD